MKSSVIVFPGSNCDRDIAVALEKFQIKNQMIWHDESNLPKSDLVILPGGFSYGDYLRTGCIASKSKIINDVVKHAKKGALVLGICNGFQILIESGLLPGVLLKNMGYKNIVNVRQGKYFDIELDETDKEKAKKIAEEICKKLLTNIVIEDYTINLK